MRIGFDSAAAIPSALRSLLALTGISLFAAGTPTEDKYSRSGLLTPSKAAKKE
ncbi:MAG: hypothetical protein Q9210_004028 [Variospora velana]